MLGSRERHKIEPSHCAPQEDLLELLAPNLAAPSAGLRRETLQLLCRWRQPRVPGGALHNNVAAAPGIAAAPGVAAAYSGPRTSGAHLAFTCSRELWEE